MTKMTKSRKVGIILAFALVLALFATSIVPLAVVSNTNVANAVTVTPRDEWTNTYSGSYYNNLNTDKVGTSFRADLANLITKTHTHLTSYDEVKSVFKTSDADPNNKNNVIWFYTGTSVPYKGTMLDSGYPTNREHVWPKNAGKAFPETTGPGGDSHHLRPLNDGLNSTRSSMSFGEMTPGASGVRIVAENGKTNYANLCYTNGTLFYPGVGYRGATARILFYMQTRWGDEWNLTFVDSAGSNKTIGKISDLMKWHLQEPPTDEEIRRNEVVAGIQGNRNPFIDHPEYAEMIYCNDGKSYNGTLKNIVSQYGSYLNTNIDPDKIPTSISLSQTSLSLTVGQQSQQITVTPTPATASNEVNWSTSNASVATVNNGVITAVAEGTATITAASKYDATVKATLSVTVNPVQLTGLTISPNQFTLKEGSGKALTLTPTPTNAKLQVTWSSSNESVAKVDSKGYVTAVGAGTATITATNASPSITATATVTVVEAPKPTGIEVVGVPTKKVYAEGEKFDPTGLTVKVVYSDNTSETFSTYNDLCANFQWLDGVTGEETLSLGTTSVKCKYGAQETTISGISVVNNIDAFLNSMKAIEADGFDGLPLREKFEAIKQAVAAYNRLTPSEKTNSTVVGKYATLRSAVRDYNEAVNAENANFQDAVTLAAGSIGRAISTTIAALIAIVKGLIGR